MPVCSRSQAVIIEELILRSSRCRRKTTARILFALKIITPIGASNAHNITPDDVTVPIDHCMMKGRTETGLREAENLEVEIPYVDAERGGGHREINQWHRGR
jgi:hypothetical protein